MAFVLRLVDVPIVEHAAQCQTWFSAQSGRTATIGRGLRGDRPEVGLVLVEQPRGETVRERQPARRPEDRRIRSGSQRSRLPTEVGDAAWAGDGHVGLARDPSPIGARRPIEERQQRAASDCSGPNTRRHRGSRRTTADHAVSTAAGSTLRPRAAASRCCEERSSSLERHADATAPASCGAGRSYDASRMIGRLAATRDPVALDTSVASTIAASGIELPRSRSAQSSHLGVDLVGRCAC